jgi:hypothetical protein
MPKIRKYLFPVCLKSKKYAPKSQKYLKNVPMITQRSHQKLSVIQTEREALLQ